MYYVFESIFVLGPCVCHNKGELYQPLMMQFSIHSSFLAVTAV